MKKHGCKYCNEYVPYEYKENGLLEIMVNKNGFLEIHYCGEYFLFDYDEGEIKIKYCPFCGRKIN